MGAAGMALIDNLRSKSLLGQGMVQGGPSGGGSFGGAPGSYTGPGGGEVQSVEPSAPAPGASFFGLSAPAYFWPSQAKVSLEKFDRFGRQTVVFAPPPYGH